MTRDDLVGIEIPEIYDGVSIWRHPDGFLENRWANARDYDQNDPLIARRRERVDSWLIRRQRDDTTLGVFQRGAP